MSFLLAVSAVLSYVSQLTFDIRTIDVPGEAGHDESNGHPLKVLTVRSIGVGNRARMTNRNFFQEPLN